MVKFQLMMRFQADEMMDGESDSVSLIAELTGHNNKIAAKATLLEAKKIKGNFNVNFLKNKESYRPVQRKPRKLKDEGGRIPFGFTYDYCHAASMIVFINCTVWPKNK